tara:strand:+ start:2313 stop:2765 length:453 start_codon:yes stop_codon:yes gene_type:complete
MSSVPLKDVCLAIDKRNKTFYNTLDAEQQKKFSAWLYMRYASSVDGPIFRDHYLEMVNDLVNVNFNDLTKHKELQWLLISLCGIGKKQFHPWIKPGKRKEKPKIKTWLAKAFLNLKDSELDTLIELNTIDELKDYATQQGLTDKEIGRIF